ncbi:hypothetical protein ACSSVY_003773, partial [Roseovarius sp. MBR-51]
MPRDGIADEVENAIDPVTALPAWVKGEKRLSSMLPYVSLVTDRTIRTRGKESTVKCGAIMQPFRFRTKASTPDAIARTWRAG